MIRKLTILACCVAATVAVSFVTPSNAEAQVFSQRGNRSGHFIGNTSRTFGNTARAFTNTTRNVVNRANPFWNGNRYYSYNNGYSYQNYQFQNQTQNEAEMTPAPMTNVSPAQTGQTSMNSVRNTTGTASIVPARSYTPTPAAASEQIRRYKP